MGEVLVYPNGAFTDEVPAGATLQTVGAASPQAALASIDTASYVRHFGSGTDAQGQASFLFPLDDIVIPAGSVIQYITLDAIWAADIVLPTEQAHAYSWQLEATAGPNSSRPGDRMADWFTAPNQTATGQDNWQSFATELSEGSGFANYGFEPWENADKTSFKLRIRFQQGIISGMTRADVQDAYAAARVIYNERPTVDNLTVVGLSAGDVPSPTPKLDWDYNDPEFDPQAQYRALTFLPTATDDQGNNPGDVGFNPLTATPVIEDSDWVDSGTSSHQIQTVLTNLQLYYSYVAVKQQPIVNGFLQPESTFEEISYTVDFVPPDPAVSMIVSIDQAKGVTSGLVTTPGSTLADDYMQIERRVTPGGDWGPVLGGDEIPIGPSASFGWTDSLVLVETPLEYRVTLWRGEKGSGLELASAPLAVAPSPDEWTPDFTTGTIIRDAEDPDLFFQGFLRPGAYDATRRKIKGLFTALGRSRKIQVHNGPRGKTFALKFEALDVDQQVALEALYRNGNYLRVVDDCYDDLVKATQMSNTNIDLVSDFTEIVLTCTETLPPVTIEGFGP